MNDETVHQLRKQARAGADVVDKIYLSTPTKIAILDHEKKRTFVVRKDGLPDAVVWNPWDKKAKAMADFGDDEYKHMLCVEAAAIEKPITLMPGEEWKVRQELSAVPSSYFSGQLNLSKVLQSIRIFSRYSHLQSLISVIGLSGNISGLGIYTDHLLQEITGVVFLIPLLESVDPVFFKSYCF